jgi:very-short-patch-repair endonuclease
VTSPLCPHCLQREPRYRGPADQVWLSGFTCERCASWHADRCRAGASTVCAGCAPVVRFELQQRLCEAILALVDALPPEEMQHLEGMLEIMQRAAAYRVPLSGNAITIAPFKRVVEHLMAELDRLDSPIEYEMHLLLDRAGLRSEFAAQQPIPVEFIRRTGVVKSPTTPDFTHKYRRLVIFCDGGHHGELRIREIDNGVVEALQARGYIVLRFTGREILQDGALCIARIRRALERASEQSAA